MIILTGGAGFIGSCFLKKLNDEGIKDIIVVDRLGKEQKWKNLSGKHLYKFFDKNEFIEIVNNDKLNYSIDAVIHLGACSTTTESDVDYIFQNNLNYSIALSDFCVKNDIKFIYASSAATYGDGSNGYSDNRIDNLMPLNPYGLSKQLFDEWVLRHNLDTSFTGIKFFNVFGPNEYHKGNMSSMIFKSYNQIIETGKVKLFKSNTVNFADGEQKRDFVYIKDCIEVLWSLLNNKDISGIFNLGTGKARSWNSLAASVFLAMNKEVNIEYINIPDNISGQYQNFTQADMSKLADTAIKYEFRTLEDSVGDYVLNHLNKQWKYY